MFDARSAAKENGSSAATWAALRPFIETEHRVASWMAERRSTALVYEFLRFGMKQAWACLFGGMMVVLLVVTHFWYPATLPLARYDFLFLAALALQVFLLAFRLETFEEAKVILVYHVVGTAMEIFKTSVGSWIYPEPSFFRIAGVPLFTGFMYSCIGSYICRAWRLFHFEFSHHPPTWGLVVLSIAIYVNFFAHHYVFDIRLALFAVTILLFARTTVYFTNWKIQRSMPLLLGLFLVSVFIWISENAGTFSRAWIYPNQTKAWTLVGVGKLGSWFLLLVISYTLVVLIKKPISVRQGKRLSAGAAESVGVP
ncbi:DUF817 domain-containing protein [Pseudorhodoplanes sinuspersici]|uniref:Uncharacterized protein n=1 Tax=Pseudorhodoplanes sinuspersici TaxID=1235591 RepID=A0A1W6ZTI7_9HYPH|nr:DUF817 domain-containing protein [Pseudorhodoplanes sinuspersici]ARQ00065.1 hypothetical protein CAK95_13965 [Pseudorhodoplanes sinuspersici]RKE71106.1 uncharacterized membrane protein YoaT (DUF817 family) [Pseudorhodoplanes sinuspersici]